MDDDSSNVLSLDLSRERRRDRPPPLSDDEIVRLRALLVQTECIAAACPVARRAIEER